MPSIQTVLGPVPPEAIRICLPHEHIHVFGPNEASVGVRRDALAMIAPELRDLRRRHDCNALVECTCTTTLGRDPGTCAELARKARVHIIASTGFFEHDSSPWWMKDAPVKELARHWTREARCGMDGTGIRPGVLKGTSRMEVDDGRRRFHAVVRRWFEALARAHHATGLPITTHAFGPACRAQFELLARLGVPPGAIAVGHADCRGTVEGLLPVVDQGGFVLLNFCGGLHPPHFSRALRLIKALIDRGHAGRILISADANYRVGPRGASLMRWLPAGPRPTYFRGYRHVFTHALPRLEAMGVTPAQIRQMFYHNPVRHLSGPW